MANYISRESAVKVLTSIGMQVSDSRRRAVAKCINEIELLHAADVAPVVHGRWEMRPTGMATDTGPEYKAYCTVCNESNKQYQPPYCPNCGARIDGGADNEAD